MGLMGYTGVDLVDDLIGKDCDPAGFPVLVWGTEGVGRTTLALQWSREALRRGGSVAFVTTHDSRLVIHQAAMIDLDLREVLRSGRFALYEIEPHPAGASESERREAAASGATLREQLESGTESPSLVVFDGFGTTCQSLALSLPEVKRLLGFGGDGAQKLVTLDVADAEDEPFRRLLDGGACASLRLERMSSGLGCLTIEYNRFGPGTSEERNYQIGTGGLWLTDGAMVVAESESRETSPARLPEVSKNRRDEATPAVNPAARPLPAGAMAAKPAKRPEGPRHVALVTNAPQSWSEINARFADEMAFRICEEYEAAAALWEAGRVDAFVIDTAALGRRGDEIVTALRDAGVTAPILVATEKYRRVVDRVMALLRGANDLLPMPVNFFELRNKLDLVVSARVDNDASIENARNFVETGGWRLIDQGSFKDLLERSRWFASERGVTSSIVAVTAREPERLPELLQAADKVLRDTDVLHVADDRRVVFFMFLTPPSEGKAFMKRIVEALKQEGSDPAAFKVSLHASDSETANGFAKALGSGSRSS